MFEKSNIKDAIRVFLNDFSFYMDYTLTNNCFQDVKDQHPELFKDSIYIKNLQTEHNIVSKKIDLHYKKIYDD